ncbi:hypothetical protein CVV72_05785 [Amycolatopsis sp. TNS106]|nr:hypothetical protein CVV72_05785 [Amycolatopsis sp. TNS106]
MKPGGDRWLNRGSIRLATGKSAGGKSQLSWKRSSSSTAIDAVSSPRPWRLTVQTRIVVQQSAAQPRMTSHVQAKVRDEVVRYMVTASAAPPTKVIRNEARYQPPRTPAVDGRRCGAGRPPSCRSRWRIDAHCPSVSVATMKQAYRLSGISTPRTPGSSCR